MQAAQVELAETAGPHSTPPRVHSGFAQGRLSTALPSLRSGRDDNFSSEFPVVLDIECSFELISQ